MFWITVGAPILDENGAGNSALFLGAFYLLLIGTMVAIAGALNAGRDRLLQGRGYAIVRRTSALLLLATGLLLTIEGLQTVADDGRRLWSGAAIGKFPRGGPGGFLGRPVPVGTPQQPNSCRVPGAAERSRFVSGAAIIPPLGILLRGRRPGAQPVTLIERSAGAPESAGRRSADSSDERPAVPPRVPPAADP